MKSVTEQVLTYSNNEYTSTGKTKYLSFFKTKVGKSFAIENEPKGEARIWLEYSDTNYESIDGVSINNRKNPGMHYSETQTRNSNLNPTNAPTLRVGKKVWNLRLRELAAFMSVMESY